VAILCLLIYGLSGKCWELPVGIVTILVHGSRHFIVKSIAQTILVEAVNRDDLIGQTLLTIE